MPGGKLVLRANEFEIRHQRLLHLLIVGAGWATYLADRDDVVWRLIRDSPSRRLLEHAVFAFATVLIGTGTVLCVRPRTRMETANSNGFPVSRFLGEWMYAMGLASLLPLWGCILLIVGESIRIVRLVHSVKAHVQRPARRAEGRFRPWAKAVFREPVKCGVFITMVVFSVSLADRVADYGILGSLVAGGILSVREQYIRATILCG
jgi:hypothetical protein